MSTIEQFCKRYGWTVTTDEETGNTIYSRQCIQVIRNTDTKKVKIVFDLPPIIENHDAELDSLELLVEHAHMMYDWLAEDKKS